MAEKLIIKFDLTHCVQGRVLKAEKARMRVIYAHSVYNFFGHGFFKILFLIIKLNLE